MPDPIFSHLEGCGSPVRPSAALDNILIDIMNEWELPRCSGRVAGALLDAYVSALSLMAQHPEYGAALLYGFAHDTKHEHDPTYVMDVLAAANYGILRSWPLQAQTLPGEERDRAAAPAG